jgi:hypothetical protein
MFLINQNQIDSLQLKQAICIIVSKSDFHYLMDSPLFIYLFDMESSKSYVINISHPDYTSWESDIKPDLSRIKLFSPTKKAIVANGIKTDTILDLNFMLYPKKHKLFAFDDYILKGFYSHKIRYKSFDVYPLSVLIKMCSSACEALIEMIQVAQPYIEDIQKFDNLYYNTLYTLEKNRIKFDSNFIYSDYNPYTITNRPTNSSYGINLSALSKKDQTRNKIESSFPNGKLVQFDYSSFHAYLLAKMLQFNIPPNGDVYLTLNEEYKFSDGETRNEIKLDFFKYVYGTKNLNNAFFKRIEQFKGDLSAFYKDNGYLESFCLKRKIFFNLDKDIQSNKIFNYFLQNAETEYNLLKLLSLNEFLHDKKSSIILYTYDSFLLDVPEEEYSSVDTVKHILENDGIPVNIQVGSNYGVLHDIY